MILIIFGAAFIQICKQHILQMYLTSQTWEEHFLEEDRKNMFKFYMKILR